MGVGSAVEQELLLELAFCLENTHNLWLTFAVLFGGNALLFSFYLESGPALRVNAVAQVEVE
jgi:hypothetical protein